MTACSDVLGPGPDVELTVSLSQEVAVAGENVTITITSHNVGEHDRDYGSSNVPLPPGDYQIFAGFADEPSGRRLAT